MADRTSLAFAGASRLAELLRAGETSPRELVDLFLDRIERLDPELNAFRKVLPERARLEADQATARLRAGDDRPLLGVPVAIKDEMGVQGEVRADGSNASGGPEPEDWDVVRRLRAAGAVVIGLTSVPEMTIWPWTESTTYGVTRNPWDLQRSPGGSSGGSAAAVAAGLVPLATASDGGGSIRIPAACCGLVGLKPQRDRISYAPLDGHWHGLSALGFLARSVEDAALAYEAVTGEPYVAAAAQEPSGLRIALSLKVPPGVLSKVDPEVARATRQTADVLRSLGHTVVERDPDYGLAAMNFSARYLRGVHDDAQAKPHPERLEARTKAMVRLGRLTGQRGLDRAMAALPQDIARITAIFDDVDVVLTPSLATLPVPVGRYAAAGAVRSLRGASKLTPFCAIWNHTGNPAIAVPAGLSASGLPLSAQLVGPEDGEGALLALGAQLQRAQGWTELRPDLAPA
jgi:amidase